jgi:hypothetical protein
MVGAAVKLRYSTANPPQHSRYGEIGSLGEEEMSIIIEYNLGRTKLFVCSR